MDFTDIRKRMHRLTVEDGQHTSGNRKDAVCGVNHLFDDSFEMNTPRQTQENAKKNPKKKLPRVTIDDGDDDSPVYRELLLHLLADRKQEITSRNRLEADWDYDPGFNDSFEMNKRRLITKKNTMGNQQEAVNDHAESFALSPPTIQINTCDGNYNNFLKVNNLIASILIPTRRPALSVNEDLERSVVFCGCTQAQKE
jgi:hypothetical protein